MRSRVCTVRYTAAFLLRITSDFCVVDTEIKGERASDFRCVRSISQSLRSDSPITHLCVLLRGGACVVVVHGCSHCRSRRRHRRNFFSKEGCRVTCSSHLRFPGHSCSPGRARPLLAFFEQHSNRPCQLLATSAMRNSVNDRARSWGSSVACAWLQDAGQRWVSPASACCAGFCESVCRMQAVASARRLRRVTTVRPVSLV